MGFVNNKRPIQKADNETTRMLFESVKRLWDAIHVTLPIGGAFAFVSLAEMESVLNIGAILVGVICTVLVTRHKLKQKEKDND